jgi:protein TonB
MSLAANSLGRFRPKNRGGAIRPDLGARQGFCPLRVETSMSSVITTVPDVFTAREIARVAGVSPGEVRALILSARIDTIDGRFVAAPEAARAVKQLRAGGADEGRRLFRPPVAPARSPGRALAASGALHAAMLAALVVLSTMGLSSAREETPREPVHMRLVFLATPGPGGGGGGGGLRQPAPPPRAKLRGPRLLRSPVPTPRPVAKRQPDPEPKKTPPPVRPEPVERPVEPPPPVAAPVPLPQVVAPVAPVAADERDRAGVIAEAAPESDSQGPGAGRGAGTGQGTGMGEGTGSGIGPGSGGGTGGGPYRAGSGITPPRLVREVKPDYTEQARRRGLEGDVVLEIVVRSNGSVGDVKVLQGLGGDLDERAIEAVRQWRFSPARRQGTPVDVIVEVAVEFKLR